MSANSQVSERFSEAVEYTRSRSEGQYRKTQAEDEWPPVPCISHPLAVAALVLEHGGTEDEAIAALLHDVAEDHGGRAALADIEDRFGPHVAQIVEYCSDDLPDDPEKKRPWLERKQDYIDAMAEKPMDAVLVSCADKVHNARSILNDHRRVGDLVYKRFKPGRDSAVKGRKATLWYYAELAKVFKRRFTTEGSEAGAYLARDLERLVADLHAR